MKKNQKFTESKGEKFVNWMKEKRFYIVLLCCIMAVSATYFVAESLQPKPELPEKIVKIPSTPLPDLTNNYPPVVTTDPPKTPIPLPEASPKPLSSTKTPAPSKAPATVDANASAQATYERRKKSALSYPVDGDIITPHTTETLIYSKTLGDWRTHNGIDIKAPIGTDVMAADDGVIEDVYTDDMMGITIVIDHQNGLKTTYSNLSNTGLVQNGKAVKRGDVISAIGDTAIYETAEVGHLHFEVTDDGDAVDPLTVFEQ